METTEVFEWVSEPGAALSAEMSDPKICTTGAFRKKTESACRIWDLKTDGGWQVTTGGWGLTAGTEEMNGGTQQKRRGPLICVKMCERHMNVQTPCFGLSGQWG